MSVKLCLTSDQIESIGTSWEILNHNSQRQSEDFFKRLYSNLFAQNPNLKNVFISDEIRFAHSALFRDMLSFTVAYLNNSNTLEICMSAFIKQNKHFVKCAVSYLEAMGSVLMCTLEQWLDDGVFDKTSKSAWTSLFLYIANNILESYDDESGIEERGSVLPKSDREIPERKRPAIMKDSSTDLLYDQHVLSSSQSNLYKSPITPLFGCCSKTGTVPEKKSENNDSIIQFHLNSNSKYKGFRRNAAEGQKDEGPVSIKLPSNSYILGKELNYESLTKISSPRSSRSNTDLSTAFEKELLPSSNYNLTEVTGGDAAKYTSLRQSQEVSKPSQENNSRAFSTQENSSSQNPIRSSYSDRKMNVSNSNLVVYDVDAEFDTKVNKEFGYDPRTKKSSAYGSASNKTVFMEKFLDSDEKHELFFVSNSAESSGPLLKHKDSIFDSSSFGFTGLETITESESDEVASSKYESELEDIKESPSGLSRESSSYDEDEMSSRVSSLSLHNSELGSSLNSDNTSPSSSPLFNKSHGSRQTSTSSEISYMKQPAPSLNYQSYQSVNCTSASLNTLQLRQRASLGFMKSCFVLKKEIEKVQSEMTPMHTFDELSKGECFHSLKFSSNSANMSSVTVISDNSSMDACMDLINSFAPNNYQTSLPKDPKSFLHSGSTQEHDNFSIKSTVSKRMPLRKRISSIFSNKSNKLSSSDPNDTASVNSSTSSKSAFSAFSFLSKRNTSVSNLRSRESDNHRKKYVINRVPYNVFAKN